MKDRREKMGNGKRKREGRKWKGEREKRGNRKRKESQGHSTTISWVLISGIGH